MTSASMQEDRQTSNPVFNDRKLKLGTFQSNMDSGRVMSDLDARLKINGRARQRLRGWRTT